ncbi:phosphate signaling complex protein PhoU [Laspinema olomoucense]|uniref:Phosphate-specific transport system accessory protein PhoU n=1 Tax=Laspinema olomoucense D3b TaxID=2953688 RepID=A0ABT2N7U1_9CYAN|nr:MULTISPECIES: phosphate signaling complex protein PhoU [unclassified Laspinema]MCT7974831.1 phosphate signaling complex protein PhoU [Laspinema sp. D3d]MCT7977346.1 phosphate signaling complex protein PhoU [Laspinema sp. D3b]MCT7986766.1 phosphate signaling complex protein PhoU [Laspinema sp. D3a]MCT7997149.1 phosphate signaling complex protein PhoU [Laspinema sp. D3c]
MANQAELSASSYNKNSRLTHFRRKVKRLERDILRMGALVENSFRLSHQALFARDLSAAEAIPLLDKQIDRFYRQIESECVMLMTLQAPAAMDSRLLGAFMQLVRDLERIGDYAQDISEIAVKLFPYPPHPCMAEIEEMSHQARAMLATSLVALADLDAEVGQRMKQLDSIVDDAYHNLYHILANQRDIKGVVEPLLLMALLIRHLERMADHATNIGQRVSYIVTGHR